MRGRSPGQVVAGERPTEVVGSESGVALSVLCGSGSQMSGIILGLTALRWMYHVAKLRDTCGGPPIPASKTASSQRTRSRWAITFSIFPDR